MLFRSNINSVIPEAVVDFDVLFDASEDISLGVAQSRRLVSRTIGLRNIGRRLHIFVLAIESSAQGRL